MARQHLVKCKYCGKTFDTNKVPFVKPSSTRYAHKECYEVNAQKLTQEDEDKKDLYDYINKLFKGSYNVAGVNSYIKRFKEEYNFSYSGIKKALVYFYEVKGNPLDKANGNIGIVPYVYKDAFNYYYSLWEAKQKNEDKDIKDFCPEERVIIIAPPERHINRKKLFTFLDEEEQNAE